MSTITKSSPKSSRTCTQGHDDYVKRWKPLCLFQCLSDPEQRCLDAFSEVVLQEGQAQVPLCSAHCLHSLRAPLPRCSLQPLIQLAYLFQPGLWDNKLQIENLSCRNDGTTLPSLGKQIWIKVGWICCMCQFLNVTAFTVVYNEITWSYFPTSFFLITGEKTAEFILGWL